MTVDIKRGVSKAFERYCRIAISRKPIEQEETESKRLFASMFMHLFETAIEEGRQES